MKKFAWLGLMALTLSQGCIYYEGTGCDGDDCWDFDWEDEFDDGMDGDVDPDDVDGGDELPAFSCTPDHAEAGDTVIAEVTSNEGVDLAECSDVAVFGDCEVVIWEGNEDGSLTVVIEIDPEATDGCDMLLEHPDGSIDFVEDAIDLDHDEETCDDPASGGTEDPADDGNGDGGSSTEDECDI